jgi:hypothetical protein
VSARLAAVRESLDSEGVELTWDLIEGAVAAADAVMFAPARIAEIVSRTGLSLQSVNEVVRELRNG